ncbi:segregation and condensation protein A [Roseicella aquatilis]|uniref:Segregation and condensation protein A n=1 Tax=Roseicella aquatilis TaxID=2527868 RepID=A0A4V2WJI6_9PROT|nr:ScpA family protein [Roseicella aquatilis]TCZ53891.1 segregation/condensation protein A [Roseicella aquatilis]
MPDGAPPAVLLRLDGFEGPLDLLLELARTQRVDLARISVVALADQYLAALETMGTGRPLPLERAADWLVMAAWLTWLKSRLLLPADAAEAAGAAAAAQLLTDRLGTLERLRALATWLGVQPQRGRDTWTAAADPVAADAIHSDLAGLMLAYLGQFRRARGRGEGAPAGAAWRPLPRPLWSVADALARIQQVLAETPAGGPLGRFLPPQEPDHPASRLQRRAAMASTLVAALELARDARLGLEQPVPFGEVHLTPLPCATPGADQP